MSMEDILKVLIDSRQQNTTSQQGNDPMTDLIGGLLGSAQPQTGGQSSGQPSGLGGMMGLLETVMGTQSSPSPTGQNDPIMALLTPFVAPLAKKANIPPEIAMVVISFVVHKLLAHHPTSGRDSNTFNLDDLLGQMNSGSVDSSLLRSSGMVSELSRKTGLNEQTAEKSLGLALGLVGKTTGSMANKSMGRSPSASKGKAMGEGWKPE